MNQYETARHRKIIFLTVAIMPVISAMMSGRPAFAQMSPPKFLEVADGSRRPVTLQTSFFTGSTGKSFTVLVLMQLMEAGKICVVFPKPAGAEMRVSLERILSSSRLIK